MLCSYCGKEIGENKTCPYCGAENNLCPGCGNAIGDNQICPYCGTENNLCSCCGKTIGTNKVCPHCGTENKICSNCKKVINENKTCAYCGSDNKVCSNCGKDIGNTKMCPYCGTENKVCSTCGKELEEIKTCPYCETEYKTDSDVKSDKKDKNKNKAKKGKKKKKGKIIAIVIAIILILGLLAGGIIFFLSRSKDSDEKEEEKKSAAPKVTLELDVSTHALALYNNENTVCFYAVASKAMDDIELYNATTKKVVASMLDDGQGYDEEAGDLIYTASFVIDTETENSTKFYAQSKKEKKESDTEIVSVIAPLTDEELDDIAQVDYAIEELQYNDAFHSSEYKDRKTVTLEVLNNLASEDLIEGDTIHTDDENQIISFYYTSGIIGLINLNNTTPASPLEAVNGPYALTTAANEYHGSQIVPTGTPDTIDVKLLYALYESNESDYQHTIDALEDIATKCRTYGFNVVLDEDVTIEDMKHLASDELVSVNLHGIYCSFQYQTGERYWYFFEESQTVRTSGISLLEKSTRSKDEQYSLDLKTGRIIKSGGSYTILPAFFDEYYGRKDFLNTMFSFESCQFMGANGTMNEDWPTVLTSKSVKSLTGYHNTVYTYYAYSIFETVIDELYDGKTISQALEEAKSQHGEDDAVWGRAQGFSSVKSPAAYPVLRGDEDARLISIIGSLRGKVADANSKNSLSGASLTIYRTEDSQKISTITTDENGNFIVDLENGNYYAVVTLNGYLDCDITDIVIEKGHTTYLENTILLTKVSGTPKAMASGVVSNALTGDGVADAEIRFRSNWGTKSGDYIKDGGSDIVVYTDYSGYYFVDNLPYGYYTIEIVCENYATQYVNIVASQDEASYHNQNIVLVPEAFGTDFRITLEWEENPRDEDAHIVGYTPDTNFHVYWDDKTAYYDGVLIANLDHDDRYGNGFETTTLSVDPNGTYYYYVHRYAGSGSLSTSNAIVKVYQGGVMIKQYNVPVDQGTGDYWNVFNIVDGKIVTINRISDSSGQ